MIQRKTFYFKSTKDAFYFRRRLSYSMNKGSKHIHARYFFVTEKIDKMKVKITCYPTENIIANYSSKPNQGSLYDFQRNAILGIRKKDFVIYKG